jgi:hypothetical protein
LSLPLPNGKLKVTSFGKPSPAIRFRVIPAAWQEVALAIHNSGRQLVVALTGGGSGALAALLQTPGASRSVLEAVVPYSLSALIEWIGGKPDQACSEPTARAMAMASFMRARRLAPEADVESLIGVGCTASLATDRPKRGERRIHGALQTSDRTKSFSLTLDSGNPTRERDESVAAQFILWIAAEACGLSNISIQDAFSADAAEARLTWDEAVVGNHQSALLLGIEKLLVLNSVCVTDPNHHSWTPLAVFPGAFNPVHGGHRRMSSFAEARLGGPVTWELSIANVDKPPLDFIAVNQRIQALQAEQDGRYLALTHAPTFVEKSALFPGATFVVGADTMSRIAEPRYYGGDADRRDDAIAKIAQAGCRFLVFGRVIDEQFITLADLELPQELRQLCEEVSASDFREDVSSTALRQLAPGQ